MRLTGVGALVALVSCTGIHDGQDQRSAVDALGWIVFVIICIAALAAPILLVATGMGAY